MAGRLRALLGLLLLLLLLVVTPAAAAAQEVVSVQVAGQPAFSVPARGQLGAQERAREIERRIRARLESDEPLAPIRVVGEGARLALVLGGDTLLDVAASDAEVAAGEPLAPADVAGATRGVARQWAEAMAAIFAAEAARERARVVVEGNPLFEVGGTPEQRAARRAAAVGLRISQVARSAEPPAVRAQRRGEGAVVLAGGEVVVEVSPAEGRAEGASALEVAQARAAQVERAVGIIRAQRSGGYLLRLLAIAAGALLAAVLVHLALGRLERRLEARPPSEQARAWGLLPVLAGWAVAVARFLVWVALASFLLWLVPATRPVAFAAAADALGALRRAGGVLLREGLIVALILVGTFFAARFAGAVVRRLMEVLGMRRGGRAGLRATTLSGTLAALAQGVVGFLGIIALLAQLRIDPVPLLASAGVAGIAIGFGVQSLIRDFFTGIFILLEDQYGVGDVVRIGEVSGSVERFTLRITQLRALDGSLTSVPNGEIKTVTNLSKDWAQAVLDVEVALDEDVGRATAVIAATAKALADEWRDRVKGEPEVLGVETVDPTTQALTIRVIVRTSPMEQWAVARELRRRILDAFQDAGIRVPPRAMLPAAAPAPPP